ncbi:trihelix transcription factor ENAP2-like isoform X2 [Andrographis paniculata]|uniref:trihelix transcription factor ENAP2-like isoform X2 n=1 Tax=Andrographis paniculata TaxID=175694 RepID=UPI0021E74816|nr:trihelix transcription factor ENAP2-like isoform X2 [Andrographis paniculata]
MGDLTDSSTPQPQVQPPPQPPSRQLPFREDCWTEEATATLVNSWGRRYLELNRGNLRQKDWQEVADAVNTRHGHTKKTRRTDVQCKNRIDTLKKKYKTEKAKIADSNGTLTSSWPFFSDLDLLIGSNFNKHNAKLTPSPAPLQQASPSHSPIPLSLPSPPMAVPLSYRRPSTPVVLPHKRPLPSPVVDESYFRRNYSAMAAAAAAAEDEPDADDDDGDSPGEETEGSEDRAAAPPREEEDGQEGMRRLAKAIERFGEIYEKVEGMKQRQLVELEKQRMQFAKDLEVQRMRLFMDTQVQLEKIKQAKRSRSSDDNYS